jgi:alpha-mannosidase
VLISVIDHSLAKEFTCAPFTLEGSPNIMLETIKRGENDFDSHSFLEGKTKTVILRLHENMGGRGVVKLSSKIHVLKASIVNILEDHVEELDVVTDLAKDVIDLTFRAFEIKTVMLTL